MQKSTSNKKIEGKTIQAEFNLVVDCEYIGKKKFFYLTYIKDIPDDNKILLEMVKEMLLGNFPSLPDRIFVTAGEGHMRFVARCGYSASCGDKMEDFSKDNKTC